MAKATDLIFLLFDITSAREIPFGISALRHTGSTVYHDIIITDYLIMTAFDNQYIKILVYQ